MSLKDDGAIHHNLFQIIVLYFLSGFSVDFSYLQKPRKSTASMPTAGCLGDLPLSRQIIKMRSAPAPEKTMNLP